MDVVKLANGKTVSWDQFSNWNWSKQRMSIKPSNAGNTEAKGVGKKISQTRKKGALEGKEYNILKDEYHPSSRAIVTPDGEFPSLKRASEHYGVGGSVLRSWIKKNIEGFSYKSETTKPTRRKGALGVNNKSAISISTPDGLFLSKKAVQAHYGISRYVLDNQLKNSNTSGFKINQDRTKLEKFAKMKVGTPDGDFQSVAAAATHYGITPSAMRHRLKSVYLPEYFYVE